MSAKVVQFREKLSEHMEKQGIHIETWSGGTRTSKNLLCVPAAPRPTVIYVKMSNNTPGFWGLTKNQIECLTRSSVRWCVVLLHCAPDAGHMLKDNAVLDLIDKRKFTLSGDGDYKVNEDTLGPLRLALVTNNGREFERVPGLKVKNWAR